MSDDQPIPEGVLRWRAREGYWHLSWFGDRSLCVGDESETATGGTFLPDDEQRPLGEFVPVHPCPYCQNIIKRELGL